MLQFQFAVVDFGLLGGPVAIPLALTQSLNLVIGR